MRASTSSVKKPKRNKVVGDEREKDCTYSPRCTFPRKDQRAWCFPPLRESYPAEKFPQGKEIQVEIVAIDEEGRIRLSQRTIKDREDREDYEKFVGNRDEGEKLGAFGELLKDLKLPKE